MLREPRKEEEVELIKDPCFLTICGHASEESDDQITLALRGLGVKVRSWKTEKNNRFLYKFTKRMSLMPKNKTLTQSLMYYHIT